MSSYHSSFSYLDKNSKNDFGWIIAAFDPDNGEVDSYLSQEQVYTDSYRGTKRFLYGTKYDSVATIKITVIKCDGEDFSVADCRNAYRWLVGNPQANWLDLYMGDDLQYSFLGTVQDVKQHKMDARTVGLTIYFESISPWAYSPVQVIEYTMTQTLAVDDGVLYSAQSQSNFVVDGGGVVTHTPEQLSILENGALGIDNAEALSINNLTDDLYTPVYMRTVIENTNSDYLTITNRTTGEKTIIKNMTGDEVVTLSAEQFIVSSIENKIFGNDFNFVWPRLVPGVNEIIVSGSGVAIVKFTYRYPVKIGDCAIDIAEYVNATGCNC